MSQLLRFLSPRIWIFCTLILSFFTATTFARDDSAEHHVRELAHRVSTELPRSKVNCVNWNNHEAVSDSRSQQWKSLFLEEMRGQQSDAPTTAGDCSVSVRLERTATQIVVTADVENGKQVLFAAIPRSGIPAENATSTALRLEKELLWQQSERILDAIFVRGENGAKDRLIVLQRDFLNVYEKQADGWKAAQSKPLGDAATAQRAPRGELYFSVDQPDNLKIVLTGKTCQTKLSDAAAPSCQQNLDVWRTGMLLSSPCGSQVWWLRSDGGDTTMLDRLELVNPSLPATQTLVAELSTAGPVVSISSGEALRADTAVVFNLSTGNYEVHRIALACGL